MKSLLFIFFKRGALALLVAFSGSALAEVNEVNPDDINYQRDNDRIKADALQAEFIAPGTGCVACAANADSRVGFDTTPMINPPEGRTEKTPVKPGEVRQ